MALRPFCDDCQKAIEPLTDNFIEVGQLGLAKDGKIMRAQNLHFCQTKCMTSWIVKATNRPTLISSPNGN